MAGIVSDPIPKGTGLSGVSYRLNRRFCPSAPGPDLCSLEPYRFDLPDIVLIEKLLAAVVVGYLIGSIPFAKMAASWRGVDIFATGSGTAGTANVFWNVGRRTGALVFVGDVAKGAVAIGAASLLGISGALFLVVGGAAILGHWKSIFAGFKGGDGMATLIGLFVILSPALSVLGLATGFAVVLLLRRRKQRSAWGMAVSMAATLSLSTYYQVDQGMILGLVGLGLLVLGRSIIGHRLRDTVEPEIALDLDLDDEPDLAPAAPEKP
jgi:glycerol-3-phosphate acyltransferase PlsY